MKAKFIVKFIMEKHRAPPNEVERQSFSSGAFTLFSNVSSHFLTKRNLPFAKNREEAGAWFLLLSSCKFSHVCEEHALFDAGHKPPGVGYRVGIDAHAVNALPNEKFGKVGIE